MKIKRFFHVFKRIINNIIKWVKAICKIKKDKAEYIKQCGKNTLFAYSAKNNFMLLYDYDKLAGTVDSHYFYQDIFVANDIYKKGIKSIYDIGSRLDGFISHLLSMDIDVTMIDIRPLNSKINHLHFMQGNATDLSNISDNSLNVITCLHALEHFGLGRYSDPIDYIGWSKALQEISKKAEFGGYIYISMPVANKDRLCFNAHRIFNPVTIYSAVPDYLELQSFTVTNKSSESYNFASMNHSETLQQLSSIAETLGEWDCGVFIFKKTEIE